MLLTDLLNSYPASMEDFICFTDDKLLKLQPKNAQNDHFCTLIRIA